MLGFFKRLFSKTNEIDVCYQGTAKVRLIHDYSECSSEITPTEYEYHIEWAYGKSSTDPLIANGWIPIREIVAGTGIVFIFERQKTKKE
jgi:hypothetical protein